MARNKKWGIPHNIHKPGTAEYYRDQLINIADILVDYDGYDPCNANHMRDLVDQIYTMALMAIAHKKLYRKPE